MKRLPDCADLADLLEYQADTGLLFWRRRTPSMFEGRAQSSKHTCNRWNSRFAGKEALSYVNLSGYKVGDALGAKWYAHRIAYKLHFGVAPETIDHINGVKTDNRASNLRSVAYSENAKNMPLKSNNTVGRAGLYFDKRRCKWNAHIGDSGKQVSLGYYASFEEALAARISGEIRLGYHENHGRKLAA